MRDLQGFYTEREMRKSTCDRFLVKKEYSLVTAEKGEADEVVCPICCENIEGITVVQLQCDIRHLFH